MSKREAAQQARERLVEQIKADPRFLYVYSPSGTTQNERWVFKDKTCFSLQEAYEYVLQNEEK